MQIKPRDIILPLVLSFITCGLYGLYWMYKLTEEIHALSRKPQTPDGGTVVLYTILTCTFYFYYWLYKIGSELVELREKNGLPPDSVSNTTYLRVTIAMTVIYVVFTTISYVLQILADTVEAAPLTKTTEDTLVAFGAMLFLFIIVFIFVAAFQSVFSGIILWVVYKRKDRNPTLLYLLLAFLRTYNFTMVFLQLSLNDFLRQRGDTDERLPIAASPAGAGSPVSLQKPLR